MEANGTNGTNGKIKIFIIGDFLIFRSGLRLLLESEKNFSVVGEAANLAEAADLISKILPEVLLIDSVEVDNGYFSMFLSETGSKIPTIILTTSGETETHQKYLLLGASGLVLKNQNADVLFQAIDQVHYGDFWFDRKLMVETIKQLIKEKDELPRKMQTNSMAALTEREKEVLMLICKGMKNKAIADSLFISETTVRHHLTSIFEKVKVNSRLELVIFAYKEGLAEVPVQQRPQLSFNGANGF